MQYDTNEQARVFKALSDANRMQILDMLSCGELCACKLLERFHITQPTLSHHMKVLTDCGLVIVRKEGVWMKYSLNSEKVEEITGFIQHLLHEKQDCICRSSGACGRESLPCK
jgi:ArsR family transcriptional regulator, arsenate/arsenite/antimonite-responsive transcriptional repressor